MEEIRPFVSGSGFRVSDFGVWGFWACGFGFRASTGL